MPIPTPREGQFLVRNLYLSFDPAMRGWMEDRPSYIPPVAVGEVMRAGSVAQVVESKNPAFRPGDFVQGTFGWQDYAVSDGKGPLPVSKLPPGVPLTWPLGVLGITGLTAYFGLLDLGKPAAGETVAVSGAAGATGSVAAQIAKLKGCRVIGIAGGRKKCSWLLNEAGLDATIDYKAEDVGARLRAPLPDAASMSTSTTWAAKSSMPRSRRSQPGRASCSVAGSPATTHRSRRPARATT